ncbi:MAG: chromosome segregation protein SMC [Gemmataceae bacterium]
MLKRLELLGFKSFADRTRFDFAPGVTAVVGPNGSGKSNLVDAVRWLLGEQSAKSLRGTEMTDVIFNGSATRKSLGLAEVTMTFDNARRLLSFDADEVQITRRVYRDGEGEYLLNGQPARLKDVKELFLGTGAGHGAYSVIEQGKVDALLAASTKDRRLIFEEAAGISRFKARKTETLRKLDRVDADLVRVHDILGELDKQLRTLRLQAAKAQRYQEYSDRLRELKVGVARAEFHDLSAKLAGEEQQLTGLRAELADAVAAAETGEAELKRLDWDLTRTEDAARHQEGKLAEARQQIAAAEATAKAERNQTAALEAEQLRLGRQRVELAVRVAATEAEAARVGGELTRVGEQADADRRRVDEAAAAVDAIAARLADLSQRITADQSAQYELLSRSTKATTEAERYRVETERLRAEQGRKRAEADRTATRHDALAKLLAELSETDADLRQRLADAQHQLAAVQAEQAELRQQADGLQPTLDSLREERSALHGRADVLDGLERSFEGFGAGVQAVVGRLRAGDPALAGVVGLVADLVSAPREVAGLIDLALGETAQRFVVRADALAGVLDTVGELPGRVGFVPLMTSEAGRESQNPPVATGGLSAASLVHSDPPALAHQLLGHVLIAADLPSAQGLAALYPGFRCLTRAGELVEPDGTVVVGPPQAGGGIVSRRSELRDLHARIGELDARIAGLDAEQSALRQRADALDATARSREAEITALTGQAGSVRDTLVEQRQVQRQLADLLELLARESALLDSELHQATVAWQAATAQAEQAGQESAAVAARLAEATAAHAAAERDRAAAAEAHTAAQVALGRVTEQLTGLRRRQAELDAELRQRRIDGVNLTSAERSARDKLRDATLAALRATAAAASSYADKGHRERQLADLTARRADLRTARDTLAASLKRDRDAWQSRRDAAHARELTARELAARRDAVAARIRDEYGVELSGAGSRTEDQGSREGHDAEHATAPAVELDPRPSILDPAPEIAALKDKITKLGQVNPEAVAELAAVEGRERELRGQFDDLAGSRDKLKHIIDQINADSRRLFTELLDAVRGHFQELFRKLFAGGAADIVLDGEDVLEAGIEITARPPGKEPQRLSLLSGGERALTAVALLLAIFRSKPSPFCLLDEVDAAMDEANTVRLAGLLTEFADRSQFVVITHKKRTMAAADVLYGVTMQESGVSKLVAVRLADYADPPAAPARAA